ncbi:MAG: hypothetical protein K1000chlam4_00774 [Chlamydiae bacterium]|nr:hypothetical protein [Chlamydiota bacterium]
MSEASCCSLFRVEPKPFEHKSDVNALKSFYITAFVISTLVALVGVYGILGSVGVIPVDLNLMAYLGQFLTSNQLLASAIGVTTLGVLMTGITYAVVKSIGWPHHNPSHAGH